jgi:hypothetical protein
MSIRPLESVLPRSRTVARARGGYVASVIMLALIALFVALLLSTPRMIRALDRELRLVEQRQLEKYPTAPVSTAP